MLLFLKLAMKRIVLILFLVNQVLSEPQRKWRESDDGSKFYVETEQKYNWFEALSECARKNMSLIAIDTAEKHEQLDNMLKRMYTTNPPFWISGHDNAVHLRFEWASTGESFSFTNWAINQPTGINNNEHCILLWTDFQWHDYPCTNKLGFICEENQLVKKICKNNNLKDIRELKNIIFSFNNE